MKSASAPLSAAKNQSMTCPMLRAMFLGRSIENGPIETVVCPPSPPVQASHVVNTAPPVMSVSPHALASARRVIGAGRSSDRRYQPAKKKARPKRATIQRGAPNF